MTSRTRKARTLGGAPSTIACLPRFRRSCPSSCRSLLLCSSALRRDHPSCILPPAPFELSLVRKQHAFEPLGPTQTQTQTQTRRRFSFFAGETARPMTTPSQEGEGMTSCKPRPPRMPRPPLEQKPKTPPVPLQQTLVRPMVTRCARMTTPPASSRDCHPPTPLSTLPWRATGPGAETACCRRRPQLLAAPCRRTPSADHPTCITRGCTNSARSTGDGLTYISLYQYRGL